MDKVNLPFVFGIKKIYVFSFYLSVSRGMMMKSCPQFTLE